MSNDGQLQVAGNDPFVPHNVFSDAGSANPVYQQGLVLDTPALASGDHITLQVQQAAGIATIEVFSVHRTSSLGTDN